jgi:hypothetical protein
VAWSAWRFRWIQSSYGGTLQWAISFFPLAIIFP